MKNTQRVPISGEFIQSNEKVTGKKVTSYWGKSN